MTSTNIYPLENLNELQCRYLLYNVRGIPHDIEGYHPIIQKLCRELSQLTHSPCISLGHGDDLRIAQLEGHETLPLEFPVAGAHAIIEPSGDVVELKMDALDASDMALALRFLQFHVSGLFKMNPLLWLPKSGGSVFHKTPDQNFARLTKNVDMYRGFLFRFLQLPSKKIGLCIDVGRKYLDRLTLPAIITRDEFRKYKRRQVVYEYGNTWYQIKIEELLNANASEVKLPDGSSLYEHVRGLRWGNRYDLVAALPRDGSVLVYHKSSGEIRRVPSGLCRQVYRTDSPQVSWLHTQTILGPGFRKQEIDYVVSQYFRRIDFQGKRLFLAENAVEFDSKPFALPKLLFGNGKTLRVGIKSDGEVPISEWGSAKKRRLLSADAGFYKKGPFRQQYVVLPRSWKESFGKLFVEDLKEQVKAIYSPTGEFQYNPTVVYYNDSVGRSVPVLGREVIDSVTRNVFYSGYGVIVIPRIRQSSDSTEDELANLLMKELRERDIYVSVIHMDQASQSYVRTPTGLGQSEWRLTPDNKRAGRFRSYLQNVAINKILLLNSFWPFVLSDPLHADLTIGVDVKNNTAGFTFVLKDGQTIWSKLSDSRYRERLSYDQCSSVVYESLKNQLNSGHPIQTIVTHRDGLAYDEEIQGMSDGLRRLAQEGLVASGYDANFLEIHKTSVTPVRFFEQVSSPASQSVIVENPQVGTCLDFGDSVFLATTGYPYSHEGTSQPILVVKVKGGMMIQEMLEDLFQLANLTWTRVDDCSTVPITIKMTDIRLREVAGDYNRDALRFVTLPEVI